MATTWLVPKNNASGYLNADIDDEVTSVVLESGDGAAFPSTFPFRVVIGSSEVVEVTARTTDTLTVTRAQESTAATAHYAGETVLLSVTAGYLEQVQAAVTALETGGGDLSAPGPIGGTTPGAGTFTALTANTSLAVTRAGETAAALTLTNSTGSAVVRANTSMTEFLAPGNGNVLFRLDGATGNVRVNGHFFPYISNTRDVGVSTVPFRNLFLGGDAYIGGGDIFGPDDADLTIHSDQDVIIRLDTDQATEPGNHKLIVKNGAGVNVLEVAETGAWTARNEDSATLMTLSTTGVLSPTGLTTYNINVWRLAATGRMTFTTITTFTADDATPTVSVGNEFKTAATGSAVTITELGYPTAGQHIYIYPTASPVTTIEAAVITNRSTDWLSDAGTVLHLFYDGTLFWEVSG